MAGRQIACECCSVSEVPLDGGGLVAERAALRRLAELVARDPPPAAMLEAIAAEARDLLEVEFTGVVDAAGNGSVPRIAALHGAPAGLAVGDPWPGLPAAAAPLAVDGH